jgi:hypothetical protein
MKFKRGDMVSLKDGDCDKGTVIQVGKSGHRSSINVVCVKWDSGKTEIINESRLCFASVHKRG